MHELGELLVAHVRHEERCLFPLIERLLDDSTLAAIEPLPRASDAVADPLRATNDVSQELAPVDSTATLFWGSGGGSHCDAAFLSDRRWHAKDCQPS
jgi:iron-sulfur cluster repair protein YtfE (RIC family)